MRRRWNENLENNLFSKNSRRDPRTAAVVKTVYEYSYSSFNRLLLKVGFFLFSSRLHASEVGCSRCKLWTRSWKSVRATIDARSRHWLSSRPTRFVSNKDNEKIGRPRRYQVDPWPRVFYQTWKTKLVYFFTFETDRGILPYVLCIPAANCFSSHW